MTLQIIRADVSHLETIVPLFDAYRQFYKRASDPDAAHAYLRDRLERHECVVFLALDGENAVGFTLLYKHFTSVAMGAIWLLNDLFVTPEAQRRGVGEALILHATEMAREDGSIGLHLRTALDNTPAQALYEKLGWKRDLEFYRYDLRF
jgi:GNAT superfamily N-acetyltransferase